VLLDSQRGHLSCSCSGKFGFMGWNVVGSCIFIWLQDNNFNWFSVEISTFKYSFESYIEKGNWGFEILIDFSIKFKALCSKIQIELLGKMGCY
jgi:hypothetical protein